MLPLQIEGEGLRDIFFQLQRPSQEQREAAVLLLSSIFDLGQSADTVRRSLRYKPLSRGSFEAELAKGNGAYATVEIGPPMLGQALEISFERHDPGYLTTMAMSFNENGTPRGGTFDYAGALGVGPEGENFILFDHNGTITKREGELLMGLGNVGDTVSVSGLLSLFSSESLNRPLDPRSLAKPPTN